MTPATTVAVEVREVRRAVQVSRVPEPGLAAAGGLGRILTVRWPKPGLTALVCNRA